MTALHVVRTGWATTLQDAGRPGYAALGVPTSGALDPAMRALLNRLVGNPQHAAVLESAGGLVLRADGPCVTATSVELAITARRAGATIGVDPADGELWGYLAVRGGIIVDPVLGSVSHDTLSGLGPAPIAEGRRLGVGPDPGTAISIDQVPRPPRPPSLRIWPGPRLDWFADDAFAHLTSTTWTVSGQTGRVGVRLDGEPPRRRRAEELPSEGLVLGAIQVPPDGRPVVMLADHPTTGGYPVIAVVDPADVGHLAQRRPGATVRFHVPART